MMTLPPWPAPLQQPEKREPLTIGAGVPLRQPRSFGWCGCTEDAPCLDHATKVRE